MSETNDTIKKVVDSVEPVFLELANYSSPLITEDQKGEWVNYGVDNLYFDYLLDRYRGSPTNSAIINSVARMIAGDGVVSPFASKHPQEYAKAISWFSLDKLSKWAFDLKCYGFYMQQIIRTNGGEIENVEFTPVENWRSGVADEDGNINTWYYCDNWAAWEGGDKRFEPTQIPAYKTDGKEPLSVFACKPYRAGSFYYPTVDYQGALQWANVEEEVGNFHLNNILNSFSPSLIINFNNGDPGEDTRKAIERKVNQKLRGTNRAGVGLLSFNENKDHAVTFESAPISDLDKQFQFISEEATRKIMVGHRVTSPLFFGIRDGAGLGSNADELKNSWLFFDAMVIQPDQNFMLQNMEKLLIDANSWIKLEIKDLTPVEFETQAKPEPQQMASQKPVMSETASKILNKWLNDYGVAETEFEKDFDLIDSREVDYEMETELDAITTGFNLAEAVRNKPNLPSDQDNELWQVRYAYAPAKVNQGSKGGSREFCRDMVAAKKVYRKEDIEAAGAVNPGWGPKGVDTYDIWLYKGGGNCLHFWERRLYLKKNNMRISSKQAQQIINKLPPSKRSQARPEKNNPKVAKLPHDMAYNGFLPTNSVYGK